MAPPVEYVVSNITGFRGNATYECVAAYNPHSNVAVMGGADGNPNNHWMLPHYDNGWAKDERKGRDH